MGESAKPVLALFMGIAMIGTVLAWMTDGATSKLKASFPALAVGSLGILLWSLTRKHKFPDFLRKTCGGYFERDGFCFAILPAATKGEGRLDVYFQNRFENPCRARWRSGLLSSSSSVQTNEWSFPCPNYPGEISWPRPLGSQQPRPRRSWRPSPRRPAIRRS